MGALTLKTYSYKSRPWELRSKDTISLKDPYFPAIRVFTSQKKILRILPIVGEEEWISDGSRFFESHKITRQSLMKLDCQANYVIEKTNINENNSYYLKTSVEETLEYLTHEIQEEEEMSVILGSETDMQVISTLREFHKIQDAIKVNVINPFGFGEIANEILPDLNEHSIFLMTNLREISPLLEVKLADFLDEGGEFYSFNITETIDDLSLLGNSFKTLQKVLSGNFLTKRPPLFIIASYLKDLIPTQFKTFVLSVPLNNYYLNSIKTTQNINSNNILNLDANLIMQDNIKQTSYLLSPSNINLIEHSFYIPVTAFWNDSRTYKTMFKSFVNSHAVLVYRDYLYNVSTILKTLLCLLR